jgi:hypothetical protein
MELYNFSYVLSAHMHVGAIPFYLITHFHSTGEPHPLLVYSLSSHNDVQRKELGSLISMCYECIRIYIYIYIYIYTHIYRHTYMEHIPIN